MAAQFIAMHKQAAHMEKGLRISIHSTKIAKKTASIAKYAADAALLNARAVINSESARLAVELDLSPLLGYAEMKGDKAIAYCVVKCRNVGRTPASVYEVIADFQMLDVIPDTPMFSENAEVNMTPRNLEPDGGRFEETFSLLCVGEWSFRKQCLIHGVVKFKDVFDRDGKATFGYILQPDFQTIYRLEADFRAYNRNTYKD